MSIFSLFLLMAVQVEEKKRTFLFLPTGEQEIYLRSFTW